MGTLSAPCPHCLHDKTLLDAVWQTKRGQLWQAYLVCNHCGLGVGYVFEPRTNKAIEFGPVNSSNGSIDSAYRVLRVWPQASEITAPEHTPDAVAKRFIEGEDAFLRRRWNSAVAMYRSALDIATKGMDGVPAGLTFFKRLEWMFQEGRITKDIREWADQVRIEGNAALHDLDDFDEDDATSLRYFTEMFLRYVFELPGKVEAFRNRGGEAEE